MYPELSLHTPIHLVYYLMHSGIMHCVNKSRHILTTDIVNREFDEWTGGLNE